jgi:hypothetical protein
VMAIMRIRTGIDKVRKELKADALAWGRTVDSKARELTQAVEALEAPWKAAKDKADQAAARKAEEERLAEEKRMLDIENRIRDIRAQAEGLLNADSLTIAGRIVALGNIVLTEENFGEYVDNAGAIFDTVLNNLEQAQAAALLSEAQAAEIAKQAEENARFAEENRVLREELDATRLAAEQAEIDRQAKAVADAEPEVTAVAEPDAAVAVEDAKQADTPEEAIEEPKTPFETWWHDAGSHIHPGTNEPWVQYGFRLSQQAWLVAEKSNVTD